MLEKLSLGRTISSTKVGAGTLIDSDTLIFIHRLGGQAIRRPPVFCAGEFAGLDLNYRPRGRLRPPLSANSWHKIQWRYLFELTAKYCSNLHR